MFTEQGDHARARAAVAPVKAASAWARRARFLGALSDLSLKKYDEAFAGFKALADQAPTPALMNNLGVAQLSRAATPQTGQPTYYFNKAVDEDPDDADYLFNLGYAYWQDHDPQAAIYWLREAVRHNPSDADAHFVLGAALAAGGSVAEATRERDLARRLSAAYEPRDRRAGVDVVPKGLERPKTDVELPHERPVALRLAATEQRDQAELAQFYLERGRRQFQQENDREAAVELNHALFCSPYRQKRTCCSAGFTCAMAGCTRRSTPARLRSGARRPPRPTRCSARPTGRPRTAMTPDRSRPRARDRTRGVGRRRAELLTIG